MKKVIVLGISIILLVALIAGCSESSDDKDDDKDKDNGDGNGDGHDNDNGDTDGNDTVNDTVINGEHIKGSGTIITVEKDITGFTKVRLGMGFVANIVQSSEYKVEIKIDDNIENYVVAKKDGDTLVITLQSGNDYQELTIKVEINLPDLQELTLREGAQATAYDFTLDHAYKLDAEDSSQVSMTGTCGDLTLNANNDCSVFLRYFLCEDIAVSAHGASRVTVNLTGALSGEVSSATRLAYYGNPTSVDVTNNGGSVTHVELR